ncbi:MAG: hypothetical protein J6X18_06650 [Bacteroidales bacterium]|nr:hypothetical protein [Bacteroidales bacterium]
MNEDNLYLVYVEPVGLNSHDLFEYEFLFSETPDVVWGEDWAEQCPLACENMRPSSDMISVIKRLTTLVPFGVAQRNTCFSMQDCIDGIVALAWEDMSEYDEYPEPLRLIFGFGEKFESVEDKLARRHQFFSVDKATSGTTD